MATVSSLYRFLDPENGCLTPDEDEDYREYIDEGDVIGLLQAKARRLVARTAG